MRKKLKHKIAIPQMEQARDVLPDSLNREEMTQIIADAIVMAEEKKEREAKENRAQKEAEELKQWKTETKFNVRTGFRGLFSLRDYYIMSIKLNRIPRDKIKGEAAILLLQKIMLIIIFEILRFSFLLSPILFLAYIATLNTAEGPFSSVFVNAVYFIVLLIIGPFIGALFRIASVETERIDDCQFLFSLSTIVVAAITMAITVILN